MNRLFFDERRRLRNGWWMLVFVALMLLSRLVYTPVSQGLQALGVAGPLREPLPFLFVLAITWICVRLRRERLRDAGLRFDAAWWRSAGIGFAIGTASVVLAVVLLYAAGGVQFVLDPQRSAGTLLLGLYVFLFVALFEELLFRGFLFQRLVAGAGPWIAQIVFALLFATGHWGNPEMTDAALVVATVELALGAVLLGLAYLRTGSLALPVGLHLGWNWAQGALFGFGVSGFDQTGWLQPQLSAQPAWLTGGAFGLEASVCAIASDLCVIVVLWKWRGNVRLRQTTVDDPKIAHAQP